MTHSELLAIINEEIEICEPDCHSHDADNEPWLALRAVVELHEPKHIVTPDEIYCDCGIGYLQAYPCPTIEAIEKELL